MKNLKIGFIGAGNLASSIIGGLITAGFNPKHIFASNLNQTILNKLHEIYQIHTTLDNHSVVNKADLIVFCVKPQMMKSVFLSLKSDMIEKKPLIISVAAGVRLSSLSAILNAPLALIRCMPNTPALVGASASGLFANAHATDAHKNIAESIFRSVGTVVWVDSEEKIDAVTALSGSGPAYFFKFMESMALAGEALGLTHEQAKLLTIETALGAAKMAIAADCSLAALREQVTSPGGTTAAALAIFEQNHIQQTVASAINAANKRADELAKLFDA